MSELPKDLDTRPRLSKTVLGSLLVAAGAGLWLGRRLHPSLALLASGAAIALRPRRTPAPVPAPAPVLEEEAPWPKAPVAPPFVPHTRAWDDLRAALSPVLHAPEPVKPESRALPSVETESLEATHPFILDDDPEDEPPPRPLLD